MTKNLTLRVDEDVLKRARVRAIEEETSVNQVVGDFLRRYAGERPDRRAIEEILRLAEHSSAGSGPDGRTWTRDDLHRRPA